MSSYEPVLLARIDKPNSEKLDGYRADGGYATFERALKDLKSEDVTKQVKDSGLRGRFFPPIILALFIYASTRMSPSPARTTTAS